MTERPDLVLFTATYPYGQKSETFLDAEIAVLARRFRRILVLPSHRAEGMRDVPTGVQVVDMDWLDEPPAAERYRSLFRREAVWPVVATMARRADARALARAPKLTIDNLARNLLKLSSLRALVRDRGLEDAIFYDYWFENTTLALAMLRRAGGARTAVARAHRFDVYDELWPGGAVPFRAAKARGLDAVFAVSAFGASYLAQRVPALRAKVRVARLGVEDPERIPPPADGGAPLIVTCGSLLEAKGFHEVPDVLARIGRPVRWVHIGDGPERPHVLAAASRLPSGITWDLLGHLDHSEVLRFYSEHHVDVLLCPSRSEGLPVSMMEAQSYGIPIVARGVHGIPEIVTERTGVLVGDRAEPSDFAAAIVQALERGRYDRQAVRAFFREHFDAQVNYNEFADALIALRQDQAAVA